MAQDTKTWYPEDAVVEVYDHEEKEIATGPIPGSDFIVGSAIAPITNMSYVGSPLAQYVDTLDQTSRRDVLVYLRKDGKDSIYDTTTTGSIVITTTGSLTFETSVTAATADNVIVSYSHDKKDQTNEVTDVAESGGGRAVTHVAVYGGIRIAQRTSQEAFTATLTVLKSNIDFAELVNGPIVTEIGSYQSTTGSITTSLGAENRDPKTLVIRANDPDTGNVLEHIFYNVLGVSKDVAGPADSSYTETVAINCAPQDKTELHFLKTS